MDYNPGWGQATVYSTESIANNNVIKLAGLNYQGIDFSGNAQDVSGLDTLHIDYWTADSTAFNFYLVSTGPAETAYAVTPTTGSWQSLDIPLSSFSGVDLADVIQMKLGEGNGTVYLDNLYFYSSAPATAPTTAPTAPTASNTISVYSDAYTDITGVDYNPGWGQATVYSTESIANNNVIKL
ncbi:MAG: glycoside hydrolase family 16 protein, partial [Actinomycetia bacterium]|nr:glycoside hydrolase family 16 protein [Actinomycetes bacterium]